MSVRAAVVHACLPCLANLHLLQGCAEGGQALHESAAKSALIVSTLAVGVPRRPPTMRSYAQEALCDNDCFFILYVALASRTTGESGLGWAGAGRGLAFRP